MALQECTGIAVDSDRYNNTLSPLNTSTHTHTYNQTPKHSRRSDVSVICFRFPPLYFHILIAHLITHKGNEDTQATPVPQWSPSVTLTTAIDEDSCNTPQPTNYKAQASVNHLASFQTYNENHSPSNYYQQLSPITHMGSYSSTSHVQVSITSLYDHDIVVYQI